MTMYFSGRISLALTVTATLATLLPVGAAYSFDDDRTSGRRLGSTIVEASAAMSTGQAVQRAGAATPLLYESFKLTPSDGASGDGFGTSVAVSGDTAIVGAPYSDCDAGDDCGSAYVFQFDGETWGEVQRLVASFPEPNDEFGISVAIDGSVAIVGAYKDDCLDRRSNCGSAYVFRINAGTWVEEQRLAAQYPAIGDRFGTDVAVRGDLAVVGTPNADCGAAYPSCGAASAFRFDGAQWLHEQTLSASDGKEGDQLGLSVAVTHDWVLAGAWGDSCSAGLACGSEYAFQEHGDTWSETPKLTPSDPAPDDLFGADVAAHGRRILVGAHWDDCTLNACCATRPSPGCGEDSAIESCVCRSVPHCCDTAWDSVCTAAVDALGCGTCGKDCGSAYVFELDDGAWSQEQKLVASDGVSHAWFGESVAITGPVAVVTAPGPTIPADASILGSAYAYRLRDGVWVESYKLRGADSAVGDRFGSSVAADGITVVVGASQDDGGRGSAFIFRIASPLDADLDGDVDLLDFASFLGGYTGVVTQVAEFLDDLTGPF